MRILAISDIPERLLYDDFSPERWRSRVDLVLSCGDLDREYLEFLVTVLDVPLLYVAGNHDVAFRVQPPRGLPGRGRPLSPRLRGLPAVYPATPAPLLAARPQSSHVPVDAAHLHDCRDHRHQRLRPLPA